MSFHVKQISRIPFYTHCRLYEGIWLVLHPLGLELDKALFGWNSVTIVSIMKLQSSYSIYIELIAQEKQTYMHAYG